MSHNCRCDSCRCLDFQCHVGQHQDRRCLLGKSAPYFDVQQIHTLFQCSTNPHSFSMFNYRQAGFAVDWCAFRLISPKAQVWIFPPLIFVDIGMTFGSYWGYWWVVVGINGCDCILQSVGGIRWVLSDFVGVVGWIREKLNWTLFRLLMRRQKTKKTRTLLKCSRPSSSLKGALWRGVKW